MNAVTQIEDDQVNQLFARFELGELVHFELAANGIENSNYFVTIRDSQNRQRDYVLTLLEQPSNIGGRAYVELIDNAVRAGLPVPAIMRHPQHGAAYDQLYGKQVLIARRLRGQHVLNPTRDQIAAIGRFLARFHNRTGHLSSYLPRYPRDAAWAQAQLKIIEPWVSYGSIESARTAVTALSSLLARQDVAELPRSIIHGDLFRDNALFNELGLSGVLDFHHAATGYCLFDLAVVANDWCADTDGALNRDRCLTLLQSYHTLRPLRRDELWHFSAFTLYAGAVFYLSRASSLAQARKAQRMDQARIKNPQEFLQVMQERLARPITIDPRMLDLGRSALIGTGQR